MELIFLQEEKTSVNKYKVCIVPQSNVQKTNTGFRIGRPSGQEIEKLFHKAQEKTSSFMIIPYNWTVTPKARKHKHMYFVQGYINRRRAA